MMKTRHSRLNIPGTETKYVLLPSSAIDAQKWDACISLSAQPVIYATHNYLNHFSDKWMGFVFGDYDAVMPVTLKEKFRLIYLYPAPFVQQSGLFGETDAIDFVSILAKHFRYGNYVFYNKTGNATYHKKIRSNYVLKISNSYENIAAGYTEGLHQSIRKACDNNYICKEEKVSVAVQLYQKYNSYRYKHVLPMHYNGVMDYCLSTGNYISRGVFDADNHLLTVVLLLVYKDRLYNVMNSTTIKGRSTEANHFLYDSIIKETAGRYELLYLEGSDLPGVQLFYKKFGAVNLPYYSIHINRLPFPLRLLKR